MDDWTKIGKSCVRAAMDELRMLTDVTALNNERNIKTSADMAAHNAVIAALEKSGVSCVLHSEEAADPIAINGGSGEVHVMLDPVDGSVFFLRGELSFCAVGILVLIGGKPGFAFVGDIAAGDIYHCDKKGAYKDGVPLRVSERIEGKPIIAGWAPYKLRAQRFYEGLADLSEKDYLIFNFGGMLSAAKIAAGRYDAWLEVKSTSLYEMAGALIAMRAGAICSNLRGQPLEWFPGKKQTVLVSRNEKIHNDILACFKGKNYETD